MPSRRRLLAAAGGLLLTGHGGDFRAVAATDPLAAWAAARAGDDPDPRLRALGWAVLAPNPHNRQPWLVRLAGPDSLLLSCDLDRRLPVTDPLDRQITIGLGCFAELFRMAAAAEGLAARIEPFPEGVPAQRLDRRPVARITLGPGGTADPLFAAAPARRSAKRPFDMARPVPAEAVAALAAAVPAPLRFGAATMPETVAPLRDLAWAAWQAEAMTPEAHGESVALMRLGAAAVAAQPDGISVWGPGIEEMVARGELTREAMAAPGRPGFQVMVDRYSAIFAATPAMVWIASPGSDHPAAFAAGQAWLRLNLAATAAGLSLHPVSQALQQYPAMAPHYAAAQARLSGGGTVQMLGRLGVAPPAPPTPRWAAATRIQGA